MKIHLLSDIHLEFGAMKFEDQKADVIVLAGDIGTGVDPLRWIESFLPKKTPIIYVPGNHEYYHRDLFEHRARMRDKAKESTKHLFFLDDDECVIDGQHFVGGTLWTDLNFYNNPVRGAISISMGMTDLKVTKRLDVDTWLSMYHTTYKFLESKITKDSIVVTHFLPHSCSVHPRFEGNQFNVAFASNTLDTLPVKPKLWMHGHTHNKCDYVVHGTRVVCNPRGYIGYETQEEFDPRLIIEVDSEVGVFCA